MRRFSFSPAAARTMLLGLVIACGFDQADAAMPDVVAAEPRSVTTDAIQPFEEADGYTYKEGPMYFLEAGYILEDRDAYVREARGAEL